MATIDYKEKYEKAVQAAMLAKQDTESAVTVQTLEEIFPELRESEDERVKNEIISAIKEDWPGHTEWIAWLEKQGEQKPFISNDALREGIAYFGITQYQIDNWLKKYVDVEKQGEQKQELLTKEKALKNSPFVEQKSAEWSEDDQSNFCELRSFIVETYRAEDASKLITWLESLKDRVQPQPKQEWSDEDEEHLSDAIFFVREYQIPTRDKELLEAAKKAEEWLKSLRPQNRWKPSDEQMDALQYVYRNLNPPLSDKLGWNSLKTLEMMYQDLKKLMEK